MSTLLSLSDELLKLILQHVPLYDRLRSCSLAHTRLRSAAAAVTQAVDLCFWHHPIAAWLACHGQHITSLRLSDYRHPVQLLPCPNLVKLRADGGRLAPSVLEGCTQLTYLELQRMRIDSAAMRSLSCLQRLQHLQLWQSERRAFLPKGTLAALTQLSYLRLRSWSVQNLQELAALTALKHLHLHHDSIHLSSDSDDANGDDTLSLVGPGVVPGMALPASLTKLELSSRVEAALLHLVPTGLQELSLDCPVEGPAEGPSSWLAGIGRLKQLTGLGVSLGDDDECDWPHNTSAYSALTASSRLESLSLSWGNSLGPPEGVWLHVFPASRSLPRFECVSFSTWSGYFPELAWGPADLSRMVGCCPNISTIECIFQAGPHVSELHKLTALTSLQAKYYDLDLRLPEDFADQLGIMMPEGAGAALASMLGPRGAAGQTLKGVAAATQLRKLGLKFMEPIAVVGTLLPLTRLTALTELHCSWRPAGDGDDDSYLEDIDLWFAAEDPSRAPDVWLQLLAQCALDPASRVQALSSLVKQMSDHKALTATQQQQLADQQQQLSSLQEQQSAQQQAAAEQAAGFQAQLQELRAELQQLRQTQRR